MTAAEKIRQVVEETRVQYQQQGLPREALRGNYEYISLDSADELCHIALCKLLDVIIEEMEEEKLSIQKSMQDIRPKGRKLEGTIQINTLAKQLYWLKEARTSLTNTNDS